MSFPTTSPAATPLPGPAPGAPIRWQTARVLAVHDETPRAKTFRLALPHRTRHMAGQYFVLRLTAPDGYTASRAYSLSSPPEGPDGSDVIELTVELLDDGEVSALPARGRATGRRAGGARADRRRSSPGTATTPALLVAGGSGIVPLMAMLRLARARPARARPRPPAGVRAHPGRPLLRRRAARARDDRRLHPRRAARVRRGRRAGSRSPTWRRWCGAGRRCSCAGRPGSPRPRPRCCWPPGCRPSGSGWSGSGPPAETRLDAEPNGVTPTRSGVIDSGCGTAWSRSGKLGDPAARPGSPAWSAHGPYPPARRSCTVARTVALAAGRGAARRRVAAAAGLG